MRKKVALGVILVLGVPLLVVTSLPNPQALGAQKPDQAMIVAGELSTIAKQLSLRPETAIDFTKVSGEYCFDVGLGDGGHMHHLAVDPTKTREDVIDFVNAKSLIKAGLNVESLSRFPGKLGSMKPNTWYFLPAGELEPHHGIKFPFPLLMKAVNVK